jgi:hypothetical protein
MPPEVIIPLVSASISSVVGATTLMITHISRQRTERIKHERDTELERERLRFVAAAYEHAIVDGHAPDLVDLTLALHGKDVSQHPSARLSEPIGLAATDLVREDGKRGKRIQSRSVRHRGT